MEASGMQSRVVAAADEAAACTQQTAEGTERPAKAARPQGRLPALQRIALGLCAAPLLALAGLYGLLLRPAVPASTGDALLDAFAAEYNAHADPAGMVPWASPDPGGGRSFENSGTPEARLLLGHIDERFADDPRYWLLLSQRAGFHAPTAAALELQERDLGEETWFLEEAVRRGAVDSRLMIELAADYARAWGRLEGERHSSGTQKSPLYDLELWAEMERSFRTKSAGKLEPLIRQVLAAGPDDAAAHYCAAQLYATAGDYQHALAQLQSGNAAEFESSLLLSPLQTLWDQTAASRNDWLVASYAAGGWIESSRPNYGMYSRMVRKLVLNALQTGNRAALGTVHQFACRIGTADGGDMLSQFFALSLCREITNAYGEFAQDKDDPATIRRLAQLNLRIDALQQQLRTFSLQQQDKSFALASADQRLPQVQNLLQPGSVLTLKLREAERAELNEEHRQFAAVFAPLWQGIAAFDYTQMDFDARTPD
jgi:hypothetical protein